MLIYAALVILASVTIGYFGRHRKMGFWGYFFGSIVLTPLIGLILLFASDPKVEASDKP